MSCTPRVIVFAKGADMTLPSGLWVTMSLRCRAAGNHAEAGQHRRAGQERERGAWQPELRATDSRADHDAGRGGNSLVDTDRPVDGQPDRGDAAVLHPGERD